MKIEDEEKKPYLAPDYDNSDDDDDDFIDEDIDEDGEDESTENFLDSQEILKNSSKPMTTTPFSTSPSNNWTQPSTTPAWGSGSSSIWGGTQQNNSSIWNSNNNNSSPSSFWQPQSKPAWGNNGSNWGSPWNNSSERKEINREKKVIVCDVLDCLVETFQSNGKPGLLPRGIYDIRFRFEVWDKIACFNPEKILAIVPISLLNCSNSNESWKVLLEYIVCSLSEYLRAPYQVCQVLLQTKLGQSKEELIELGLTDINREDVICLGVNSGMQGQNNRDRIAAMKCGIDYIDLATFMNSYY